MDDRAVGQSFVPGDDKVVTQIPIDPLGEAAIGYQGNRFSPEGAGPVFHKMQEAVAKAPTPLVW